METQGITAARNADALLSLMEKTGYSMIQENGQRKYGGPPPNWEGPPPGRGCEIFIGKIPRDCFEDELVPAFERQGKLYELRLMMDFSGSNRGYAFVMYTNKDDAQKAIREMNNFEIRKGRFIGVCASVDNCRLFVGGIPKNKNKREILQEMQKITEGVLDVIVYPSALDKTKNRGFAFVEYESHRCAAMARRKLLPGRIQLWGHQIAIDWAEPEQEVDDDVMNKVKILYVRNLMVNTSEDTILREFSQACGDMNAIERVKKIKDYAFVHFKDRDQAVKALRKMNGAIVDDACIEVVLAKPVDKAEYLRYSRGKSAMPHIMSQGPEEVVEDLSEAFAYGMQFGPQQGMYGGFGRTAVGVRGMMRGRGRAAAGYRGAATRGGFVPGVTRMPFPRFPPVEGLYDITPGMDLRPTHPVTLKPYMAKTSEEFLEEVCQKNVWGAPIFELHSTVKPDGSGDLQLFVYWVTIPALASNNPPFQPTKLCRTIPEAKIFAAQYVLAALGYPVEGADLFTGLPIQPGLQPVPMPQGNGVPPQEVPYSVMKLMPPPPPPQPQLGDQFYPGCSFPPGPPPVTRVTQF